jgi:hypothetical protein
MAKYLITYDLVGTDETSQDYKNLIAQIKTYATWGKVQKSVWVVKSTKRAATIYDELNAHMDANDRLFVVSLRVAAAWKGSICNSKWLKQFLESD